jgi:hypothetical protein
MHPDLNDELAAAIGAERAAWNAVKDRLPGTALHDAVLWDRWRLAVERCRSARKALASAAAPSKVSSSGTDL